MIHIQVHATRILFKKDVRRARNVARFVLDSLKKKDKVIDIFLLSQSKMQKINKQWHGKDEPTNILSFAERDILEKFPKIMSDENYLGEIYISPDFVLKHKQSFDHMVIHGILHVLGYDHIHEKDAEKMEKIEKRILKALEKHDIKRV